jgi:hypothetical protein
MMLYKSCGGITDQSYGLFVVIVRVIAWVIARSKARVLVAHDVV